MGVTNNRNSLLGRDADITVDRQQGMRNVGRKSMSYLVKMGFFTAEKDLPRQERHMIYIMGAEDVSDDFRGKILATIKRPAGERLLFVAAPEGKLYCEQQIRECLGFYERQYKSDFEFFMTIVCGMILVKDYGDRIRFLLAEDKKTKKVSFIKDVINYGESEKQASVRVVNYFTGIKPDVDDFKTEYTLGTPEGKKQKTIMYFGTYTERKLRIPEECSFRTVNLEFDQAIRSLDDPQERILLMEAKEHYDKKRKGGSGV